MCIWKDEKVNLCEQIWVWDYILIPHAPLARYHLLDSPRKVGKYRSGSIRVYAIKPIRELLWIVALLVLALTRFRKRMMEMSR